MQLTAKDFRAIRMPAIALVIAIAAAVAMVEYSSNQRLRSEKQYQDELKALREAQTKYQRSGEERETVTHYLQAYRQLEKIGFIGNEQRLNWLESLRTANAQAGLFGVDYQLSAQESYPYVAPENPLGGRIKQSRMRLSFGVLHEGELSRLFQALAAQQPGLYAINSCSLDRAGRQGPPVPRKANLTADCELSWLTIDPKGDKS
ncbi:MAG TPA: hypothetical protein VHB46_08815 [Burkholderiales bacterium]|nr:hypothetical protein [Burkholderiales bacterium]